MKKLFCLIFMFLLVSAPTKVYALAGLADVDAPLGFFLFVCVLIYGPLLVGLFLVLLVVLLFIAAIVKVVSKVKINFE